jgi:hypothetical protein
MGWDWQTYNSQPLFFIQVADMMRQLEGEEIERSNKKSNGNSN